jgi:hypothetical protein
VRLIRRSDHHEAVAEERAPGLRPDEFLALEVVHPVEIGRYEQVRGRALFDLPRERGGGRIRDRDALAGRPPVVGRDRIEGVLEARRGKDRDVGGLRDRAAAEERKNGRGRQAFDPESHGCLHGAPLARLAGIERSRRSFEAAPLVSGRASL